MGTITGLDSLQKMLGDASRAFEKLDGEIAELNFDPDDPASVRAAIRSMEIAIDRKVGAFKSNAMVAQLIPQMKAKYRDVILAHAKSSRANRG
jgi:hypothetical protein